MPPADSEALEAEGGFTGWSREFFLLRHYPSYLVLSPPVEGLLLMCCANRPIDELAAFTTFATKNASATGTTRYAVRQVLQQEALKLRALLAAEARSARSGDASSAAGAPLLPLGAGSENHPRPRSIGDENAPLNPKVKAGAVAKGAKRDFFGRVIVNEERVEGAGSGERPGSKGGRKSAGTASGVGTGDGQRIWVSFHEGYSNAVRKPISLRELMEGF